VFLVPVWDDAGAQSRDGQFCSDFKWPRDYKNGGRKTVTPRVTRAKEKYETQHEGQDQGQLPRSERNHQGEVGKVTNDRNLNAKGKAEKKAGEVQQRIGRAKDTVAKLKGKLKELKTR
jgi:uncharacterized protein YjbJ (UPF0337 family)